MSRVNHWCRSESIASKRTTKASYEQTVHTNAELVLAFLSANPDQAFTPTEIHEEMEIARGSVGVVLSRIDDRNLVRHRGEYWAIEPDADVDTTLTSLATSRSVTEQLGPEDPEKWGPGVEEDA